MTNPKFFIIGLILAFTGGILTVYFEPVYSDSASASVQYLYQTSQPPLPKEGDVALSNCDWLGKNCQSTPITDDQREQIFDNWCYTTSYYHVGKVSYPVQTIGHDCESYILDQKLNPITQKLDNLTNEIEILKNRIK